MPDDIRDLIAEELGYTVCPMFGPYDYGICDRDCANCQDLAEFEAFLEHDPQYQELRGGGN